MAPTISPSCCSASRSSRASSSAGSSNSTSEWACRLFSAKRLSQRLDEIGAGAKTRGVNQFHRQAVQVEPADQVIPGGAGLWADQGAAAGEGVEEAALASVGPAGQHHPEGAVAERT